MKPKLIITVEGGIVQGIAANVDCTVVVADFDTEGGGNASLDGIACLASVWEITTDSDGIDFETRFDEVTNVDSIAEAERNAFIP